MPRYDDRYGSTRLYVGRLSSRTRSRDLEDLFSRYGRVRDVDLKHDFAFVEFSDPRDADDARYSLNGREFSGSRIIVEFAKGGPRGGGDRGGGERGGGGDRGGGERGGGDRGGGGSREYLGRGPPPGSGRCFNCGLDGHWARDCKAGDWKNKCYRCGERGHIERNCQNSPKELKRGSSYSRSPSRSPSPRRSRKARSRSYSRSHSYSRSRSPAPARRERSVEREEKRSKSPRYSRSPKPKKSSPPPSRGRKRSPTPDENSPQERVSPPLRDRKEATQRDGSEYSESPRAESRSPASPRRDESPEGRRYRSPQANGHSRSPSPRDDGSPVDGDDDGNRGSPRGSESPSSAQN